MAKDSPDQSTLSVLRPITDFPDVYLAVKDIVTYDPARDGVPAHIVTDEITRLQNELKSSSRRLPDLDRRAHESIELLKNLQDNTLQDRNTLSISCGEYEHMNRLRKGSSADYCGGVTWYIENKVRDSPVCGGESLATVLEEIFSDFGFGIVVVNQGRIKWGVGYDQLGRLYFDLLKNQPKPPSVSSYQFQSVLTGKNSAQEYQSELSRYKEASKSWLKSCSVIQYDLVNLMRGASSPFFVFENESDKDYMNGISLAEAVCSVMCD